MIVILAGVSGSGKTTVGSLLAGRLGWPFADGDSFHPAANIAKMTAGLPLTDADRWPWLAAIGAWMDERAAAGGSAVVACSALKRAYRDFLRKDRPEVRIVFLAIDREAGLARLKARHGHFFAAGLLDSQLADVEVPRPAEGVLVLDSRQRPGQLAEAIMSGLGLTQAGARPEPGGDRRIPTDRA